ncbi:MAG: heavy metal resistance protein [Robiginitomaculum sp.]|nr:MAG: heavy metal resistance protein [Robiginitomaculum sp.]
MRNTIIVILISLMVGFCGVWMGTVWFVDREPQSDLHSEIHRSLNLSKIQLQQIHQLEKGFSSQKETLEQKLKVANDSLSIAIQRDHMLSAGVDLAGNEYLQILGELQTATLNHIFQMRALLNEEQAEQFDQIVIRSLHDAAQ